MKRRARGEKTARASANSARRLRRARLRRPPADREHRVDAEADEGTPGRGPQERAARHPRPSFVSGEDPDEETETNTTPIVQTSYGNCDAPTSNEAKPNGVCT